MHNIDIYLRSKRAI